MTTTAEAKRSPLEESIHIGIITGHLLGEQLELAGRATSCDQGGGDVIMELVNNMNVLWNATVSDMEDSDLVLLTRALADASQRLRDAAIEVGLVEERDNGYVAPGPGLYSADTAVWVCKQLMAARADGTIRAESADGSRSETSPPSYRRGELADAVRTARNFIDGMEGRTEHAALPDDLDEKLEAVQVAFDYELTNFVPAETRRPSAVPDSGAS